MSDILKCPWCGEECGVHTWDIIPYSQVRCSVCGARGPEEDTEAEAIRAWNRVGVMRAVVIAVNHHAHGLSWVDADDVIEALEEWRKWGKA